jgi:nucleotide-binding universal stress UspA family protein
MRFLIYADEGPASKAAARLGGWLAGAAGAQVTLLGSAPVNGVETVPAAVAQAQALLPDPAEVRLRPERRAQALLAESAGGSYDLIVVGSRGRRGWARLAFGSVAARLARYAETPVLIVKGPPRADVTRILACTAGDVRGERAARWGGRAAGWAAQGGATGVTLTVLHVMSQMAVSAEAPLDQLIETAEQAMARETREGRHLARALEVAQAHTGRAEVRVRPKLRHGLVLDGIMAEAREGDYDLVVIGGHTAPDASTGTSRLRAYLLEDVAEAVVLGLERPVLVVKGG